MSCLAQKLSWSFAPVPDVLLHMLGRNANRTCKLAQRLSGFAPLAECPVTFGEAEDFVRLGRGRIEEFEQMTNGQLHAVQARYGLRLVIPKNGVSAIRTKCLRLILIC